MGKFKSALIFTVFLSLQFAGNSLANELLSSQKDIAEKLKACTTKADVVFLIDSSHSVGEKDFKHQVHAIADLVSYMTKGKDSDQFRFGAITYATKADMVMSLKDFVGQPKAASNYIRSAIEYKPGQSGLGEGLKLVELVGFDIDSGHREKAEKVLVVFADGQGNTDTHPAKTAENLRENGVIILSVGVGNDVNNKYMESITGKKNHVLMANGFQHLHYMNSEIMGMVCHHFRAEAKPKKHGPCPAGQKLEGNACIIVGPTCKKPCPENYVLVYPCLCIVEVGKCPNQCPKGMVNNKKCECVPEHPPKCTLRKCPLRYTLNKAKCKCECKKRCNKNLFTLSPGPCKCVCNSRCRENYILNTKRCTCEKIRCGKGYILYRGKCRNDIQKICPHGELLFKDICLKQDECPNGFLNQLGICKPRCPYGQDDDGNCVNSCKIGEFLLNGNCQKITPMHCEGASHFAVPAPMCPRTCDEPVPLTRCSKAGEPQPGCVCDPGFFLFKGKCVRASECPNKPICLKEVDLLFMIDSSVNVGEQNFFLMKSFVRSIVQEFDIKDGSKQRVGFVTFNEKVETHIRFNDFNKKTHEDLLKIIMNTKYKAGNPYLGEAFHYARSQAFIEDFGMREDVPRMIMLLTRGNPSSGTIDAMWEARKIRELGITLVVIGIGENIESKTETLFKIAGNGGKVFVFALRKLQEIHGMISRVVATKCDSFVCPSPRVIHHKCEAEYQQLDRVEFYADGFKCQKTLVRNWKRVRCDCPKERTVRTSCVGMYREIVKYRYKLDKVKLICEETSQKMKIRCRCPNVKKEITSCQDMIKRTKFTFFRLLPGGPEGFKCEPQFAWRSIRCDCPTREITHGPCRNNFRVKKTTFYNLVQGHCVSQVRTTEIQCSCPRPKIHTSACDGSHVAVKVEVQNLNEENTCDSKIFVGYKPCKQSCKSSMDVGILVDTSKSMDYSNFPLVRSFVAGLVETLPISRSGTHVAVGRFSSTHKIGLLFDFYTFYSAKQAVDRINDMRYYPGSSSTGEALQMMRLTAFSASHGSRADVSRVLYILTDTESNGDANVFTEARKLRGMGIQVVVIGIGKHISANYLHKLASKPHAINVFLVRDYESLMTIKDQALESRCDAPGTVNHISVMREIRGKLREIHAQGGVDYSSLGLTKLDIHEMSLVSFIIKNYFSVVAGVHEWQQTRFKDNLRAIIAKALSVELYEIMEFNALPGPAESKLIKVNFRIERGKGAAFVKLYKTKKISLLSINKKPLELDASVAYISPYALFGYKYVRQVLSHLKEMADETMMLLKHETPTEREALEVSVHKLNKQVSDARTYLSLDQTKLVNVALAIAKNAAGLARSSMNMAQKYGTTMLKRTDIETWEVHLINRHLKNLHEYAVKVTQKTKSAIYQLKTAQLDDVVKGKALPSNYVRATEAPTAAVTSAKPVKK